MTCRSLLEQLAFTAIGLVLASLNKPKSSPGPGEELLERQSKAEEVVATARKEAAAERAMYEERLAEAVKEGREDAEKDRSVYAVEAEDRLAKAIAKMEQIEKELKEAEEDLRAYPLPEYLTKAAGTGAVMIAVTGASGVGKSSWINATRKLRDRDPGASPVGVNETTTEPVMYKFPGQVGLIRSAVGKVGRALNVVNRLGFEETDPIQVGDRVMLRNLGPDVDGTAAQVLDEKGSGRWEVQLSDSTTMQVTRKNITGILQECVLWDLPGVGTPKWPQDTYLKRMGIRHFDLVVVMTASRFTEAELMLVKDLDSWGVPYFLVRNKADCDVESEIEKMEDDDDDDEEDSGLSDEEKAQIEQQTLESIRGFFKGFSELRSKQVYCISCRRKLRDQFDFRQLEEDMEEVLREQRSSLK